MKRQEYVWYNTERRFVCRTSEAVEETIRICRDRDILREYLSERKKEVLTDEEYGISGCPLQVEK